jgi:hypothetical protein
LHGKNRSHGSHWLHRLHRSDRAFRFHWLYRCHRLNWAHWFWSKRREWCDGTYGCYGLNRRPRKPWNSKQHGSNRLHRSHWF